MLVDLSRGLLGDGLGGIATAIAESTSLCEKNAAEPPTSEAECSPVSSVHFVSGNTNEKGEFVSSKVKLLEGSNTVECNGLLTGTVEEPWAVKGSVKIATKLSYSSCNLGCKTAELSSGELSVLRESKDLGSVAGRGPEFKLECPFVFTCDYTFEGSEGHWSAGLEGKAHVAYESDNLTLVSKLAGPFTCPTTGALDGLYESLTPVYLRS